MKLKSIDAVHCLFSYSIPFVGDGFCAIWTGTSPNGFPQLAFGTHQNSGLHVANAIAQLAPAARSLLLPGHGDDVGVVVLILKELSSSFEILEFENIWKGSDDWTKRTDDMRVLGANIPLRVAEQKDWPPLKALIAAEYALPK